MNKMLLFVALGFFLTGNASARICPRNKNFPLIEKGMALTEVTKLIGKPISAESGPESSKILYYCLASSFLDSDGSDTREYWVQTIDGKVIGYGERNDAATMQRAQRQHASAWASAQMITDSANQAASRAASGYGNNANALTQINMRQNTVVSQPVIVVQPAVVPTQTAPSQVQPPQESTSQPANESDSKWRNWGKP